MRRKTLALALAAGALTIRRRRSSPIRTSVPATAARGRTTLAPSAMPLVMAPALGPMNWSLAARAS